jgi:nucleotidyltransferase substrate binding protein (TIGR01987 family)
MLFSSGRARRSITVTLDLSFFEKALSALDRGLARASASPGDEELRDACIQRFEFTFELAWNMLKPRLELDLPSTDEVDAMSYRTLIRVGAERGSIEDVSAWFACGDKRNLTSYTYDAARAADVLAVLPRFAVHARDLLEKLRSVGGQNA